MVSHWTLSDSKSPQVSRILPSILAVLNNAVVWMVTIRPPTSKSWSPFNNHFVTVPKEPTTIDIIVTFMFHTFFNSLANSMYVSFFSHSFSFILLSAGTANSTILQIIFFSFLIIIRSGTLAKIRWSVSMSKSHKSLCHFLGQVLDCAYVICLYSQIQIYSTSSCGSPCPPSHVSSYTPSVLIWCIHLLCDWCFHLSQRIAYICYFVASSLVSHW